VGFALLSSSAATAEADRPEGWCKTVPTDHGPGFRDGAADPIMYLNRCIGGCTISPGINNSGGDTSNMITEEVTLSEFAHGDEFWNEVVDCVNDMMRPYDIEVVTEDPGSSVNHLESMVAGTSEEAGMEDHVLGVSPVDWRDCLPLNRTISFSFANSPVAGNSLEICETVTHEAGHTIGLSHEMGCDELMLYNSARDCGAKYFRDESYTCGEEVAADCICGDQQQNAHIKMLSACGPGAGAYPPELSVIIPADGETVDNEFRVRAYANDPRGIRRVELVINDWPWSELEGYDWNNSSSSYTLHSPNNLPDGYLDIEVIAYNDLDVSSSVTMTVLKGSACANADSCLAGQSCSDGRCAWPAPSAEIGDECAYEQDCIAGTCRDYDGEQRCSQDCFPSIPNQCPGEDLECIASGANGLCWPTDTGGGGGCCSVEGSSPISYANVGLFLAVVLMLSRRRRPRAHEKSKTNSRPAMVGEIPIKLT
jgi:hypothetical protein